MEELKKIRESIRTSSFPGKICKEELPGTVLEH
jgi:hypothetical protein